MLHAILGDEYYQTPKFTLRHGRYDETTQRGRLLQNLSITDPRTLLIPDKDILEANRIVEEFRAFEHDHNNDGKPFPGGFTDEQLWHFRKLKESSVHPDLHEIIYRPFRMSGFVPYGTPLVFAMLIPAVAHNPAMQAVAQIANQTHNAAVNWANRSIVEGTTPEYDIARGYTAAVASAVTVSTSVNWLLNKAPLSANVRNAMKLFIPFPAVAVSSCSNMVMMRLSELEKGIAVCDPETDEKLGISKIAARNAVCSTAESRILLSFCAVGLPQICYAATQASGLFCKFPRSRLPLQAFYTIGCFGIGVPVSLSLFTQDMTLPLSSVEESIQAKAKELGCDSGLVHFNKGL